MSKQVFEEISGLTTEGIHTGSQNLDALSVREILEFMSEEDQKVAHAVNTVLPEIEQAIKSVLSSFQRGGRLVYIGAGTSGRLGILDASECPPTFGTDPGLVVGRIAGGKEAVFISKEGVEDNTTAGVDDLKEINITSCDTIIGIASSSRTPYVLGALEYARSIGSSTALIACNPGTAYSDREKPADTVILPLVGPEIVMGSTRLKAGTATKMILNMITTTSFIRCGKVYKGMMVDLKAWSEKLKARSRRVLMLATGLDYEQADAILEKADGKVKTAIVMTLCNVGHKEADRMLDDANGFVRDINDSKDTSK